MGCNIVVIVRNLQRITLRIVLMYAGIAIQLRMIQKIAQTGVSTAKQSTTALDIAKTCAITAAIKPIKQKIAQISANYATE